MSWEWTWDENSQDYKESEGYRGEISRETNWHGDESTGGVPVAGGRIQEWIKNETQSKVGYLVRGQNKEEDGYFHVRGFANEADYMEWAADREGRSDLVVAEFSIPDMSSTTASYVLSLVNRSASYVVSTDGNVVVKLSFTSAMYSPIDNTTTDTGEDGVLTIQTRVNENAQWATRGTMKIKSVPRGSESYVEVDISQYLSDGTQNVRMIVRGETSEATTGYVQMTVVKTQLTLELATAWEMPMTGAEMVLEYRINGTVDKRLHYVIDGRRTGERYIGAGTHIETPLSITITDSEGELNPVCTHGIHTIEAWLSVAVEGVNVESEHIVSQVFMLRNQNDKTAKIWLNDVASILVNWTQQTIFRYAVYNPMANTLPLRFDFSNYGRDKVYASYDMGEVQNGTRYTLANMIELEDSALEYVYLDIVANGEVYAQKTFPVDNSQSFAPTEGADFIFNPKLRTNTEVNPATVVNAANGQLVASRFSGFGWVNDGYVEDENGARCLRVMAGDSLHITGYEAFSEFMSQQNTSSLTMEFDFAVRNITNEDEPILKMCTYDSNGNPIGWEMKPLEASFGTVGLQTRLDQDIAWAEGVRTHVAVNIVYNLANRGINYIRIFINGKINREISYAANDTFVQYVNGVQTSGGILIGAKQAEIDIYGMRIYKKALSSENVRKDCEASLPTSAEKHAYREANDIMVDGVINYEYTKAKYNTMLWKPNARTKDGKARLATYGDGDLKQKGDLVVSIVGDAKHSGTLTNMTTKGQGTSSMSYWKWNQRFEFEDDGFFVSDAGDRTEGAWQLEDGIPYSARNDAKLNWASSQQSHKMGSTALYNDLWKIVIGKNPITETEGGQSFTGTPGGYKDCRVCVKQKQFHMFVQETEGSTPVYYGMYTFGPGKGDKPTFGYDKSKFPNYTMLEGCSNNLALVMHRVPWDSSIAVKDDEIWQYNGENNWELSMGSGKLVNEFKEAFNWVYLHHTDIHPYVGTLAELKTDSNANRDHDYWMTSSGGGAQKYDLCRYDIATGQWVAAGANKATLNLYQQCASKQGEVSANDGSWNVVNDLFIGWRREDFKANVAQYYDVNDALFTMMFLRLVGATDNRGKNTYLYKVRPGDPIMFLQDDLDSIFPTDNVGRKTKPYWIEEHDLNPKGQPYWNSSRNAFYNLMEETHVAECREMMHSIFQAMVTLSGSVERCLQDYYYSIQEGIPAVAYNEVARLLYEDAAVALKEGRYTTNTPPLPQCLGDQLLSEKEWNKKRTVYLQSYATFGEFDGDQPPGAFSFRSITTSEGKSPVYQFVLKPHQWLYPSTGIDSTVKPSNVRVMAGETFTTAEIQSDGNTNIHINGINYYRSIGNLGKASVGEQLAAISGARLTEFVATDPVPEFRVNSINSVSAPNIEVLDLTNVSTLEGSIDLRKQIRLQAIRLAGTNLKNVELPETDTLTTLVLPNSTMTLKLVRLHSLASVTINNTSNVTSLTIDDVPKLNSLTFLTEKFIDNGYRLNVLKLTAIDWKLSDNKVLDYLLETADVTGIDGRIELVPALSFAKKQAVLAKLGNVDDPDNRVSMTYPKIVLTACDVDSESESIDYLIDEDYEYILDGQGNKQFRTEYQMRLANPQSNGIGNSNANTITGYRWYLDDTTYASIDERTGLLTVKSFPAEKVRVNVCCTVYTLENQMGFEAKPFAFSLYYRQAEVGDYVYHDGTFSAKQNPSKTVIGRCYYVEELEDGYVDRRMVYENNLYEGRGSRDTVTNFSLYNGAYNTGTYVDEPLTGSHGISGQAYTWKYANKTNPLADIFKNGQDPTDGWVLVRQDQYFSHGIMATDHNGTYTLTNEDSPESDAYMNTKEYFRNILRASGCNVGDVIPLSRYNFLRYIVKRNYILNAPELQDLGIPFGVPAESSTETEWQNVTTMLNAAVDSYAEYQSLLFPGFSYIYAYEPNIKVPKKFKKHMWFAPSIGDCVRIWYLTQTNIRGAWPSSTYAYGPQVAAISSGLSLQSLEIGPIPLSYDRQNYACCAF